MARDGYLTVIGGQGRIITVIGGQGWILSVIGGQGWIFCVAVSVAGAHVLNFSSNDWPTSH